MRQRRSLRGAGGSAGELNVDWIVELQPACAFLQRGAMPATHFQHVFERKETGSFASANADHRGQRRQADGPQHPRSAVVDLGREFAQHADIIAGLEPVGCDKRFAAHFVEGVVKLGETIGGVDVDENSPRFTGRELGDNPFGIVGRPNADAVAGLDPECKEPGGEGIDAGLELAVRPANALVPHD